MNVTVYQYVYKKSLQYAICGKGGDNIYRNTKTSSWLNGQWMFRSIWPIGDRWGRGDAGTWPVTLVVGDGQLLLAAGTGDLERRRDRTRPPQWNGSRPLGEGGGGPGGSSPVSGKVSVWHAPLGDRNSWFKAQVVAGFYSTGGKGPRFLAGPLIRVDEERKVGESSDLNYRSRSRRERRSV